jgi:hypothetical protein
MLRAKKPPMLVFISSEGGATVGGMRAQILKAQMTFPVGSPILPLFSNFVNHSPPCPLVLSWKRSLASRQS